MYMINVGKLIKTLIMVLLMTVPVLMVLTITHVLIMVVAMLSSYLPP